jgi:hypothetical protein
VVKGKYFLGALAFYPQLWEEFIEPVVKSTTPIVGIQDGVWVNALIDAIYLSMSTGCSVSVKNLLLDNGLNDKQCEDILDPPYKFSYTTML